MTTQQSPTAAHMAAARKEYDAAARHLASARIAHLHHRANIAVGITSDDDADTPVSAYEAAQIAASMSADHQPSDEWKKTAERVGRLAAALVMAEIPTPDEGPAVWAMEAVLPDGWSRPPTLDDVAAWAIVEAALTGIDPDIASDVGRLASKLSKSHLQMTAYIADWGGNDEAARRWLIWIS